ncbi:MAG: sugar ABC transporter substrate-binding protein [Candidatus Omnitrophica bacterium]|nr:sugar ABC transporter substrate-binding protein [Candidatus Omnitrophota bacterium]
MKKCISGLVTVLVALSFVFPAYCAQEAPKKIKIGVSLPTQRDERWVRDAQKMKDVAKAEGIDLRMQVCDNDASKQMSQCENLIAAGIDILILAPHDATSAAAIVDNAKAAGLKVISYDRLVLDADVDLYVSFDNFEVGRLMGEYLTKLVPKGNYAVFAGAPTDNNAKLYRDGALSAIKPFVDKGDVKIVMDQWITDWQPTIAMNLMQNALTANNNKIDAIVAPNDNTAGGIIQALEQVGLAGKVPVTGQDAEDTAAERILKGTQTMTVFKNTKEQAAEAIHAAVKMVKGEDPSATSTVNNRKKDVPSILLKPVVVDKSNIDDVLIKSGFIKIKDTGKK